LRGGTLKRGGGAVEWCPLAIKARKVFFSEETKQKTFFRFDLCQTGSAGVGSNKPRLPNSRPIPCRHWKKAERRLSIWQHEETAALPSGPY